jgi:hypothetical protein
MITATISKTRSVKTAATNRNQHLAVVSLVALFLLTALFSLDVDPNANRLDVNLRTSAALMDAQMDAIAQFLPAAFGRNSE